jgi:hypothetical protein
MKYEIKLGAHVDILNKDELHREMQLQTDRLIAIDRGLKHMEFSATGVVTAGAVTIPSGNPNVVTQQQIPIIGPEDGFVWALQRVTIDGLTINTGDSLIGPANTVTDPGAGATIATVSGLTPGIPYSLSWTVSLSGTVTSADADNMELTGTGLGATDVAIYPGTVGNYPQQTITVISPTASISVKAIAAASGASAVYGASLVATPLSGTSQDRITIYKNSVAGSNHLFSVNSLQEFWHGGSRGVVLLGGTTLIAAGSGLISTGTLTMSGEAVSVPAEMIGKIL